MTLVIPCYCESERLPAFLSSLVECLARAPFRTTILIVDDGSPAWEQDRILQLIDPVQSGAVTVLKPELLQDNTGKGGAILHGWKKASANSWLAFVDADGAVHAEEVRRVLTKVYVENKPQGAYFATRSLRSGRKIERTLARDLSGRIFTGLSQILLDTELSDSQCGFKVISQQVFKRVERGLAGYGLCFDLELYTALRSLQIRIEEVPVDYRDQAGGHVNPLTHGPQMLWNLIKIRRRSLNRGEKSRAYQELPSSAARSRRLAWPPSLTVRQFLWHF